MSAEARDDNYLKRQMQKHALNYKVRFDHLRGAVIVCSETPISAREIGSTM